MNGKRIVILGGGFAGVAVLNKLQDRFQTDVSVDKQRQLFTFYANASRNSIWYD
jgi:NADH dehydrogenase FAD-containing subunit